MDFTEGRQQVFEAGSIPRQQVSPRRITGKCCLILTIVVGVIVWIPILVFIIKYTHGFVKDLRSPHTSLARKDGNVQPLVNSTSSFDVLATVWLDVTHHLKQGHLVPEEYKVVHYKQFNGEERSEAILYSGIIFENASMASRLHSSTAIRIPVEPLYTQPIGFSTLRGTIQLVPRNLPASLKFKSSEIVYPAYLPIGPRSPQSYLLTEKEKPSTLDEALERSAVNINLVKLLSSKWRLNETDANLRRDFGRDAPMLDGAPSNRHFAKTNNTSDFLVDNGHRLRLPHIQTRSRVILVKEEQKFDPSKYSLGREGWVATYRMRCVQFNNTNSNFISKGDCQRFPKSYIFENKLNFINEDKEDGPSNRTFYAPYLTQSVSASAYRHLRTIPRFSPLGKGLNTTESALSLDQCLIPMLETDESNRFFTFNWDVFFSTHEFLRATTAENAYQHYSPQVQDFKDNGTEIRSRILFSESFNWGLQATGLGDREHPNSKPWFTAFRLTLITSWYFVEQVLSALYWYTRSTSQGLSWKSQSLSLAASAVEIAGDLSMFTKSSMLSFFVLLDLLSIACILVPAYLQLSTLLHFDIDRRKGIIRRQANKKERDTRRLDDQKIAWMLSIGLALGQLLLLRYTSSFKAHVVSPQGCQDFSTSDKSDQSSSTAPYIIFHQLSTSLRTSSILTQLLFNIYSKTYAGAFKITEISSIIIESFTMVAEQVERLSGWQVSCLPILVSECIHLGICFAMACQAILLPGIPQAISADSDEDTELM